MKIGILTFHNSDNYGAVLQAFALQNKLIALGNETTIIDYICKNKISMYKILRINKNSSLKNKLRCILDIWPRRIKRNKIELFTKEKYNLSKQKYYSSNEINSECVKFDMYICGSDQIWNCENTKFDKAYFLDFEKNYNKKMSYAASFGIERIPDKFVDEYKELLKNIKFLSVRENTGKQIVKNITDRECSVVLDPTLLLNKDEWGEITNGIDNNYKNYILLYTLHNSNEIYRIAKQIQKQTGCRIVKINTDGIKDMFSIGKNIIPGPLEFVNLINNARYIVTDSFHGTAFSINLNKNFFVYLGKGITSHSRMKDLLELCGLENRVINSLTELNLNDINFDYANNKLKQERNKSIQFIINSLNQSLNDKENTIIKNNEISVF